MTNSMNDAVFYHIYALGFAGAQFNNDFCCERGYAFEKMETILDELKDNGFNAILIGPIFESSSHGYDTVDYYHVDRRLGNNESFAHFCKTAHSKGFKIVLDAVFNHTGRDFFAFKDIQKNFENSIYKDWYLNLDFSRKSTYGDNFNYDGWAGCMNLIKLNGNNQEVRNHLFGAVDFWMNQFQIDGLRLDAADVLSPDFMDALHLFCSSKNPEFWLMGEVVHGNYSDWAHEGRLDSVTNYEAYKGLWSSFNSHNLFEIAYSLNRQFGPNGIYKNFKPYNFADNHDVDRVASTLTDDRWLFPLYGLLFTMPGIPSVYYGSQNGIRGKRNSNGDRELRPALAPFSNTTPDFAAPTVDSEALKNALKKFAEIRKAEGALKNGSYRELTVKSGLLIFERTFNDETILVAVNAEDKSECIYIEEFSKNRFIDLLNGEEFYGINGISVPSNWLRILKKA